MWDAEIYAPNKPFVVSQGVGPRNTVTQGRRGARETIAAGECDFLLAGSREGC